MPLVIVNGHGICWPCIREVCEGAIPERINLTDGGPVYWWWCVCGLQVRRGPYCVDLARVAAELAWDEKRRDRELDRIEDYRMKVEGVASAGVMLCWQCAAGAGDPLPAPAPPRFGEQVIDLADRRTRRGAWPLGAGKV